MGWKGLRILPGRRISPGRRAGALLFLAAILPAVAPEAGEAQEGASLAEVESLMAQGRIMEARGTLETWWTSRFSQASGSDRQHGIWLRGKLTVDPSMAELDFRRLVLEFPGGPYTDDAMYRLGLSADQKGELREASSHFERLVRDYPSSPRLPEAHAWIRSHRNQVAALPEAAPVSEPTSAETPSRQVRVPLAESRGAGPAGEFAVQLGAFRSLERALSVAQQVRESGHDPRVVRTPGNDLARVRVGRFPSRDGADQLARALEALGFEVTLATDAGSEERIGSGLGRRVP